MADLTRRAFIGRTLLTGATIASGGLSTLSTSPTTPTVAKVATTFKNLNVLSPKAKAYRVFLKGLVGGKISGSNLKSSPMSLLTRTPDPEVVFGNKAFSGGKNVGRRAFETAIKKPDGGHVRMEAKQGIGNPGASDIAQDMRTEIVDERRANESNKKELRKWKDPIEQKNKRKLAAKITSSARQIHANEIKAFRKGNPNSKQALSELKVRREFQAQNDGRIQATKTTSTTSKGGGKSGGGAGKWGGMFKGRGGSPWNLLKNDKSF
jgi:hypothetical protein